VKTGWRLYGTITALLAPLFFLAFWFEGGRFTKHFWQVPLVPVLKWTVAAIAVVLLVMFIEQRDRR